MASPTPDFEGLADRLRDARVRNGWTQRQVAEWAELSEATVAQYEAGRMPGAVNLGKLATGLRVTADWLLGIEA